MAPVGVAHRLEAALRPFVGGDLPVRLRAWDGSEAGPVDAPLVELRSRDAVRRLLWHPGELGAAQAYVTGEIEVHHDLDDALTHVWSVAAERGLAGVRPSPGAFVRALRAAVDVGALGKAPALPGLAGAGAWPAAQQAARPARDQPPLRPVQRVLLADPRPVDGLLLGLLRAPTDPSYTVAATRSATSSTWSASKLGLEPGMRFLDVGCGWGSLSLHAAQHYGAQVTGVTIAAEQKKFIDAADPRARARGPGRDPAPGLPRDPRDRAASGRPSTRRLDRDGRARRRAELRHLRAGPARRRQARRARADPADVPRRRPQRPPRRRAVHRVVHRARHAHAAGRRDRRLPRARGSRGA